MKVAAVFAIVCAYGVLIGHWIMAPLRRHVPTGPPSFGDVMAAQALFLACLALALLVLAV